MGQEAQSTSTILHGNGNNALTGQILPEFTTIMLRLETTTMDKHHHRQRIIDRFGWGDNTEIKTVFIHHVVSDIALFGLWGPLGHILSLEHALPRLNRLWSLPTEITHRGCRKGDGFIHCKVCTVEDTLNITCFYMRFQQWLSLCSHHAHESADYHE